MATHRAAQRITQRITQRTRQWSRKTSQRLWATHFWHISREDLAGYGYALLGIATATLVGVLVERIVHISNISLLYLLVVLALAAWVGRGPALVASALAFFAYDLFFIPPYFHITVDDPTEWLSLIALLVTSLVTGQLASTVRDRVREALQSQQRTMTLYRLAQLIATSTDQTGLFNELTQRLLQVFAPAGATGFAILLPSSGIYPAVRALTAHGPQTAEERALRLTSQTYAAEAAWALAQGQVVGDILEGTLRDAMPGSPPPEDGERLIYFVPLTSRQRTVGLLALTGRPAIRSLVTPSTAAGGASPQRALFVACCDQIAFAIDRADLQQQAIHTGALIESNQLKDVFLGSVSHDLRTPLASIKAAVTSLLDTSVGWNDDERREFLQSIDESADRLNRLVGNLLDISRQEAGVATPAKDWHLIGDVIASVLDRLELTGQLQGREIAVEVGEDIPLVPMDHTQIEQVLTNLLENAVKYSPVDCPIRIVARVVGEMERELEVRISDRGIGIAAPELHAIFDKFYRVQHVHLPWANERPPTGTGLGLAISQNIVRAHDGRIWAESTPGEGSTFIFRLPIPAQTPQGTLPEAVAEIAAIDQTVPVSGRRDEVRRGE
jgi:two-component system, OmpR family, sensor histidine kinase KdpD